MRPLPGKASDQAQYFRYRAQIRRDRSVAESLLLREKRISKRSLLGVRYWHPKQKFGRVPSLAVFVAGDRGASRTLGHLSGDDMPKANLQAHRRAGYILSGL